MSARKTVEFYIDLYPGWQDSKPLCVSMSTIPPACLPFEGSKRFRVLVELPCFGGTSAIEATLPSVSREIKASLQSEAHGESVL